MLKNATRTLLLLSSLLSLQGCAATVGQQFRDIMAEIDAQCKKDHQGPYYDATIPNNKRRGSCDILSIKPADPLATEEGRFAYSIKLPEPHDKLKTEYSKLMSASVYFKALCEKDAGEWIFRTVEGVEGVFQGRKREPDLGGYSDLIFFTREFLEGISSEVTLVQPYVGTTIFLKDWLRRMRGKNHTFVFIAVPKTKASTRQDTLPEKTGVGNIFPISLTMNRPIRLKADMPIPHGKFPTMKCWKTELLEARQSFLIERQMRYWRLGGHSSDIGRGRIPDTHA